MSSAQQPPQFGRRGAAPARPAPAPPQSPSSDGLKRSAVIALIALGVGGSAFAIWPSGKSCEDKRRENPNADCAGRATSVFFFSTGGFASPAATGGSASPAATAAHGPRPIPDIAPKAAASAPAVARGGFGAAAASFSHSSGA